VASVGWTIELLNEEKLLVQGEYGAAEAVGFDDWLVVAEGLIV
jgi:hypothetical protein